jgi:UPF0755 protein
MKSTTKTLLVLVIIGAVALFGYLFYKEGTLPVNKNDQSTKQFVVHPGEGPNQIAKDLESEGFIRSKIVFYAVVKQLGIEKNIQAGDFQLSPSMDAYEVARTLTHGTQDTKVTIIEGLRKEEIAQILVKQFNITETEFNSTAKEGMLFPDTYQIPSQADVDSIVKLLTDTFNQRYNESLKGKVNALGLSDYQAITLASLVEREARTPSDRQKVASIILRRLKMDMPLQIDATIQYALGYQKAEKTWWKAELSEDDLKLNSPYNTYKNTGLPPTPICNPSLSSLQAVAAADANTPYLYYISDKAGKNMHFAKTLEEHNENITKYLR